MKQYDVIVVGAGHAGCEAALAASRMGCLSLMFTMNINNVGWMPCNPSIGGPAKGQIVGEIDALGGEMGVAADTTYIQLKILNRSRGPAVHCLRSQNDKRAYNLYMRRVVETQPHLELKEAMITDLVIENDCVKGVLTHLGKIYYAKAVIITTGTFLNGKMHIGLHSFSGGRSGEFSAVGLTGNLEKTGLKIGRLKTGTPPRLDARTIDFSQVTIQPGDPEFLHFSFRTPYNENYLHQIPCYLTRTTPETHQIILNNLDRSPMYAKVIKGVGPRYCPSIEDKVVRFQHKESHQIFLEPEGRNTNEIYPQGLNTSLPEDVQEALLKTMPGLENVEVLKPGYAVEYDFVYPDQLFPTLETRKIKNLFLAGQINGTSGYEEAAGQGIVSGINAALSAKQQNPFILTREESYIGTMIDDLITKNIFEPYRMMTSRSEYRLSLRQDNAVFRLSEKSHAIGLLSDEAIQMIRKMKYSIENWHGTWKKTPIPEEVKNRFSIEEPTTWYQFFKRPEVDARLFFEWHCVPQEEKETIQKAAVEIKYEGYLQKQEKEISKIKKMEHRFIPTAIDYDKILGLKKESCEKFKRYLPKTLYEAKRIAGINPADIMVLLTYMEHYVSRETVSQN